MSGLADRASSHGALLVASRFVGVRDEWGKHQPVALREPQAEMPVARESTSRIGSSLGLIRPTPSGQDRPSEPPIAAQRVKDHGPLSDHRTTVERTKASFPFGPGEGHAAPAAGLPHHGAERGAAGPHPSPDPLGLEAKAPHHRSRTLPSPGRSRSEG